MTIDGACEFCRVHDEKLSHLFFEYQYSKDIWSRVLHHYGILRSVQTWDGEVQWAAVKSRSTKERIGSAVWPSLRLSMLFGFKEMLVCLGIILILLRVLLPESGLA